MHRGDPGLGQVKLGSTFTQHLAGCVAEGKAAPLKVSLAPVEWGQ